MGKDVDILVQALSGDRECVRAAAVEDLVTIGSRAVGPLIHALSTGRHTAQCAAADALGRLGDPTAAAPLVRVMDSQRDRLFSDPTGRVTSAAQTALLRLGKAAVVPLMRAERSRPHRLWAELLLREMGGRVRAGAVLDTLVGGDAADTAVVYAVKKGNADLWALVFAWLHVGQDEFGVSLRSLLLKGPHWGRLLAAQVLGRKHDSQDVALFLAMLAGGDDDSRLVGAVGLAWNRDPRGVKVLIQGLQHRVSDVRCAAAEALGRVGHHAADALGALQALARGDDRGVRSASRESVRCIKRALKGVPTELVSASAPVGSGSELEAASAPGGRGTELEAWPPGRE